MKAVILTFIFGCTAIITAVLLQVLVPKIVNSQVKKNLVIKDDNSERYKEWKYPTLPIRIKFFVFNITNGPDIKKGKRASLQQVGPYVYREYMDKKNISFSDLHPEVSYDQEKWFTFDKDESCATCHPLNNTITTINAPYVIMAEVANNYSGLAKFVINTMLVANKEELLMTKTVHELIWGYNDYLFEAFAKLREKWKLFFIPEIDPFMNYQPNNTYDGFVTINTGAKDISKVGVWESWRGQDSLKMWKTKYANMFNGSDGTQFPPGVTRDKTLYFFSPNLCRSVYVTFDRKEELKGIDVLRFTTPEEVFENSTQNPNNAAFCNQRCYPTGILTGPKPGCEPSKTESPIVVSAPHFLYGGPTIRESVEGLHPDKEKHGLFFSVEPMTGVPLQALIRLQLNLHIREVPGIFGTVGVREAYVPVLYFSNEVTVDNAIAKMLRKDMILPLEVCYYSEICLFCLGGILLFFAIFGIFAYRKSSKKNKVKNGGVQTEKTHLLA